MTDSSVNFCWGWVGVLQQKSITAEGKTCTGLSYVGVVYQVVMREGLRGTVDKKKFWMTKNFRYQENTTDCKTDGIQ